MARVEGRVCGRKMCVCFSAEAMVVSLLTSAGGGASAAVVDLVRRRLMCCASRATENELSESRMMAQACLPPFCVGSVARAVTW